MPCFYPLRDRLPTLSSFLHPGLWCFTAVCFKLAWRLIIIIQSNFIYLVSSGFLILFLIRLITCWMQWWFGSSCTGVSHMEPTCAPDGALWEPFTHLAVISWHDFICWWHPELPFIKGAAWSDPIRFPRDSLPHWAALVNCLHASVDFPSDVTTLADKFLMFPFVVGFQQLSPSSLDPCWVRCRGSSAGTEARGVLKGGPMGPRISSLHGENTGSKTRVRWNAGRRTNGSDAGVSFMKFPFLAGDFHRLPPPLLPQQPPHTVGITPSWQGFDFTQVMNTQQQLVLKQNTGEV